jgi:hypothetical protein
MEENKKIGSIERFTRGLQDEEGRLVEKTKALICEFRLENEQALSLVELAQGFYVQGIRACSSEARAIGYEREKFYQRFIDLKKEYK